MMPLPFSYLTQGKDGAGSTIGRTKGKMRGSIIGSMSNNSVSTNSTGNKKNNSTDRELGAIAVAGCGQPSCMAHRQLIPAVLTTHEATCPACSHVAPCPRQVHSCCLLPGFIFLVLLRRHFLIHPLFLPAFQLYRSIRIMNETNELVLYVKVGLNKANHLLQKYIHAHYCSSYMGSNSKFFLYFLGYGEDIPCRPASFSVAGSPYQ